MERLRLEIVELQIVSDSSISVKVLKDGEAQKEASKRSPTRRFSWESEEAVRSIRESNLQRAYTSDIGPKFMLSYIEGGRVGIPITAVLGGDLIHDVEIRWDEEFPGKKALLAAWVMKA